MRIFDVPAGYHGAREPLRVAVHGSCRVHDPFEALAAGGTITKVWANNFATSYTLGEAHQMLQHFLGNMPICNSVMPFVFDEPDKVPPWTQAQRRILEGVDAFIIEVSELRQVRYRNAYFQHQVFIRNFVSRYGSALLQWYGPFSIGAAVSDELVHKTLSEIPGLAKDERTLIESILREARLEPVDVEAAKLAIDRINCKPTAQWTFVSHFVVPGLSGTLMQDRIRLSETISHATEACGVGFFDPSATVAKHGREFALANGGTDIYHYDRKFESTIAEELLQQIYSNFRRTIPATQSFRREKTASGNVALQAVASALNVLLVSFHRQRLAQSNIDESGLYAHYAALLERNQIVSKQGVDLANLMLHHLPEFDSYDVLKAGLGEVAFLLAAFGRQAVALDPFRTRFSAIVAGAEHLHVCGFLGHRLRIQEGIVSARIEQGRTLAVADQLAITVSAQEEEEILKRLEAYDAILFCPSLLVRPRQGAAEEEAVLDRFRRAGFTLIRDYPHLNVVYCAKDQLAAATLEPSRSHHDTVAA